MTKAQYDEKRNKLLEEATNCLDQGDIPGYEAKEKEIKELDNTYQEIAEKRANVAALRNEGVGVAAGGVGAAVPFNVLNGVQMPANAVSSDPINLNDPVGSAMNLVTSDPQATVFGTDDYRLAFKNYIQTGAMDARYVAAMPAFMNADAYTGTGDAGAVIPTHIVKEMIKVMETYGQIWAKVRKLNIQGGVAVPILSLKPTANWVGEGSGDRQKVAAGNSVSFNYYGLEVKIAISLLASIVTLEMFESEFVTLAVEAIVKAMELAIIKGDGAGKMLGLTVDPRVPVANKISISSADMVKWEGWKKKVFAKMKLSYKNGCSIIMSAGTFEGYIDGMVDANGQKIGGVTQSITEGSKKRFNGKPVIEVEEEVITNYEDAAEGDVIAVICKLSDYAVNSNLQMRSVKWIDQDTNQVVQKVILICDGKVLDPNGVYIVTKGA